MNRDGKQRLLKTFGPFVFILVAFSAHAESLIDAEKSLADEASAANTLFSLSFYFDEAGRPFSALKAIDRAIEKDAAVPGYFARRGQLLLTRKRTLEAAAAYGHAADMDPATKSFRGAEARAYANCSMYKEAIGAWEKLLKLCTDNKEILDAANNLAALEKQQFDWAGAESAWRTAWEKLDGWDERLRAANELSGLLVQERAALRVAEFWEAWFTADQNWEHRREIMQHMTAHVTQASAPAPELLQRIDNGWATVLGSAPNDRTKRDTAVGFGNFLMDTGQPGKALMLAKPLLHEYLADDEMELIRLAGRAYVAQNDMAGAEKFWRGYVQAKGRYEPRAEAASVLIELLHDPAKAVELRRILVNEFNLDSQTALAQTLTAAKQFDEAIGIYRPMLTKARKDKDNPQRVLNIYEAIVDLYAQAVDADSAVKFIKEECPSQDPSLTQRWLNTLNSYCGEAAAHTAALRIAEAGGERRLGAAYYLRGNDIAHARAFLDAAGADSSVSAEQRYQALQQLRNFAGSTAENIALTRRMLELPTEFWTRFNEYQQLASYLAQEGLIKDGVDLVRASLKLEQATRTPAPNALQSLGNFWRGSGVGPGLRTEAGLAEAMSAVTALYRERAGDQQFATCFDPLCKNLAELSARRGDTAGGVKFLDDLCAGYDSAAFHEFAAGLLLRKHDELNAWREYLAYSDALAHEINRTLERNNGRQFLPGIAVSFVKFVAEKNKGAELRRHFTAEIDKTSANMRSAHADVLLAYVRAANKPEDMLAALKELKDKQIDGPFYKAQADWANAAIKLSNAGSRSDTQQRENLLASIETWKKTLEKNPEDYQAAINLYKVYVQLGRKVDGQSFLDKALELAPKDPLVLECHARELMLDKKYGEAAKELIEAAKIAGRPDDVEATIESAYELAGRHVEALKLALDALAGGHNNGQGIRNADAIMDLAERSNGVESLRTELRKRLDAAQLEKKFLAEPISKLALRVAWERHDAQLANLALDALLALAWRPGHYWNDEWEWRNLATQAENRNQTADAIRINQALMTTQLRQRAAPDAGQYEHLAQLMIYAGNSGDAAELMLGGMDLARTRETTPLSPNSGEDIPWDVNGRWLKRGAAPRAQPKHGDSQEQWVRAILSLAANEAASGADTFRKAGGERFSALLDAELKSFGANPADYNGVLSNAGIAANLGALDAMEAVWAAATGPEASVAAAQWRAKLVTELPLERRPKNATLAAIAAACDAALAPKEDRAIDPAKKARWALQVGWVYESLLSMPEEARMPDVKPDMALKAFDQAAALAPMQFSMEATRAALNLARRFKLKEAELTYTRKVHTEYPNCPVTDTEFAKSLLQNGKAAEAIVLLRQRLHADSPWGEYSAAGSLCLFDGADTMDACDGAAEFFNKSLTQYEVEMGTQLDGDGKPLPDSQRGNIRTVLAIALAISGKTTDSITALFQGAADAPDYAYAPKNFKRICETFEKTGKLNELRTAVEAKLKEQPHSLPLRLALADVLEKSGADVQPALIETLYAAKAMRAEVSTVKRLIAALRKSGDNAAALAECRLWSSNFPWDEEAHKTLAAIYHDLNNPTGEVQALTMLVESAPREAAQCRATATAMIERKDYTRARALLERAVELRSEEPWRVVDLAEVCLLAQDYAKAEELCHEALTRDWRKGLSPELLARTPNWTGTFETRAHALLTEAYQGLKLDEKAAHERMQLPAGYKRPTFDKAIPRRQGAG